jgi:hypothetical protein
MQGDLNMNASNNGYSIISLVFFITYTIFQIPATVIIRKVGPRLFIASIVLVWGAVMIVRPPWRTFGGFPVSRSFNIELWLRPKLANHGWFTHHSRRSRGWNVSRQRLPSQYLVSPLRTPEAQCNILPNRKHGLRIRRYPSLWVNANGWNSRESWLGMDLYCKKPTISFYQKG